MSKLNAIVAEHDQEIVAEAQMGKLRLINSFKATMEKHKGSRHATKVSPLPRSKKFSIMFVEDMVNGKTSKAIVDTGATHNSVDKKEATRLGLHYTKDPGILKIVNTNPTPIYCITRGVPLRLGEWKGTIDLTIVSMNNFPLVLGVEFMDSIRPCTWEKDGTMTIFNNNEACSIPTIREDVEAKMLSAIQVKKGV
ncbi:Protein DDI1-like protein [Bienertia sinuspersici]